MKKRVETNKKYFIKIVFRFTFYFSLSHLHATEQTHLIPTTLYPLRDYKHTISFLEIKNAYISHYHSGQPLSKNCYNLKGSRNLHMFLLLQIQFISIGRPEIYKVETLPWTSSFCTGLWELLAVNCLLAIKFHSLKCDPWGPIFATKGSTKPPTKSYSNATTSTLKIKSNIPNSILIGQIHNTWFIKKDSKKFGPWR